MIPTRLKMRLPRTLTWPLGAKAVTEALADAPHVDSMTLRFADAPVWPASEFRRLLREGSPYLVFVAEYRAAYRPNYGGMNFLIDRGFYDAHWELRVNPVLCEVRATAAAALRESGLPAVVAWLRTLTRPG